MAEARAERLHYSAETFGHQLKKIGLSTRRLGKAGKGLAMDLATTARIHELASVYGDVGLEQDESNLHCPLCIEKKWFIQEEQVMHDFRPEDPTYLVRSGGVRFKSIRMCDLYFMGYQLSLIGVQLSRYS